MELRKDPLPGCGAAVRKQTSAGWPPSTLGCETPEKNHLRWVMPYPEEKLLDALARLHAAGTSSLGEGTRLVGSFRVLLLPPPIE